MPLMQLRTADGAGMFIDGAERLVEIAAVEIASHGIEMQMIAPVEREDRGEIGLAQCCPLDVSPRACTASQ